MNCQSCGLNPDNWNIDIIEDKETCKECCERYDKEYLESLKN